MTAAGMLLGWWLWLGGAILPAGAALAVGPGGEPDAPGESAAFLEMQTEKTRFYEQEPIRVRLLIGFDAEFFEAQAIQPFRRRLDVPVQVQAEWLDGLPGTVPIERPEAPGAGDAGGGKGISTIALNDGVAEAVRLEDRVVDGRAFAVLALDRSLLPVRPGDLEIPASRLRFAYATRFEQGFGGDRLAEDRRDVVRTVSPIRLQILPLPEEGRPPEFSGAVGRLRVHAEAEPREVFVGESLKLTLRIEGEGNLAQFEAPRLEGLEGFHVFGSIDDKENNRRLITYDLAPLREEVRRVPPIPFAFFDTEEPAGYRVVRTEAIPLVVRPLPEGASLAPLPEDEGGRVQPGKGDLFGLKPVVGAGGAPLRLSPALIVGGLLAPWVLAWGVLLWKRARERDRRDPAGARARGAAGAFHARVRLSGGGAAEAFSEYLAARLRCAAGAVVDPNLAGRLEAAGVPPETAARAAAFLESQIASRYGSGEAVESARRARDLVEELEACFRKSEGAP